MDLERERTQLLKRETEWAMLGSVATRSNGSCSYWTDDASLYPPGMPVIRVRLHCENTWKQDLAIPGFHITWTTTEATLSPTADWRTS